MKPDDGSLQLDRLRAEEAPELHRALNAVKQQLPTASELAALSASLSSLGLPPGPPVGVTPATAPKLPFPRYWLALGGAAVCGVVWLLLPARSSVTSLDHPVPRTSTDAKRSAGGSEKSAAAGNRAPFGASAPDQPMETAPIPDRPSAPGAALASPPPSNPGPIASTASPSAPRAGRQGLDSETAPARPRPRAQAASASAAAGSKLEAGPNAKPSEIELLRDARLALQSSPNLALGLTDQHASLYPLGKMAQERELIAISALVRLGRHAAVLSRAQRFERDFPNSPYRQQIAQMAQ